MVSLRDVKLSNSRVATSLPAHLVAVYVGATSGIGEASMKQFAKYALQPKIYFVGRSQEAGDRIEGELKKLNPQGEYIFVKADVSLIRVVDEVCADISNKEKVINLLFLCTGTLVKKDTPEGLDLSMSVAYYSRARFILNLLPLLRQAPSLRRVITVFAGTYEGPIDLNDIPARKVSALALRGHEATLITFSLESLAKQAPEVSFIHSFPGSVKSNLVRGGEGALIHTLSFIIKVIGPLVNISAEECGERHTFLATSARFPAGQNANISAGVPLANGVAASKGTDGKVGSGVYSLDSSAESGSPKIVNLLAKLRKEGVPEKLWKHTEDEYSRILGSKS